MAMRDDFSRALGSTESASGDWSFPSTGTARRPRDFQSLYERERARADRERARADAAEARCEELRWAEVAARSDAGSWKSRFEASRHKRQTAVEEAKEARRAAKEALSLEAEVARLKTLLADAGVDMGKGGAVVPHRMTAQGAASAPKIPHGPDSREARQLRKSLETTQVQKFPIKVLRYEVLRSAQGGQGGGDPEVRMIRALSAMIEHLRARLGDFQDRVPVLSWLPGEDRSNQFVAVDLWISDDTIMLPYRCQPNRSRRPRSCSVESSSTR